MKRTLYEDLYRTIADEIRTGNLKPGAKLPSIRRCADERGLSRNTVIGAYSLLLSEGYITAKDKSGYYVAQFESTMLQKSEAKPSQRRLRPQKVQKDSSIDLSANLVDSSLFPFSTLRRLYRETLSGDNISILENAGPFKGERSLRASIVSYLYNHKGIDCTEDQVIIGNGTSYHLQMLPSLFRERTLVLMESPGFKSTQEIMKDTRCRTALVPVDEEGASIAAIRGICAQNPDRTTLVHISPSHQFPLGTTMTAPRRLSLIGWANEDERRYIIEDDYDSDFRYNGHPIPSLKSMDTHGNVIYLGTFSRTLTPSIRISYMILPPKLLEVYERRFSAFPCPVSRIDQKALSLFMDNGHFERHISRMRRIYRTRRNAILAQIRENSPSTAIQGDEAGLHFIARFPLPEDQVIARAEESGFRLQGTGTGWVIIGYSHLSEQEIRAFGTFAATIEQTSHKG